MKEVLSPFLEHTDLCILRWCGNDMIKPVIGGELWQITCIGFSVRRLSHEQASFLLHYTSDFISLQTHCST